MHAIANLFLITGTYLESIHASSFCQNVIFIYSSLSRKSVSLPLKWFTIGQCWRYERMTRGRRREHYQWNMDIFGVPKVRVPPFSFIDDSRCCCAQLLVYLWTDAALPSHCSSQAEAELLHAIVLLFQRLGITSSDVGIRVSSRKVTFNTQVSIFSSHFAQYFAFMFLVLLPCPYVFQK